MPITTNANQITARLKKIERAGQRATRKYLPPAIEQVAEAGMVYLRNNTPVDPFFEAADTPRLRDTTAVSIRRRGDSIASAVFRQTKGVVMKGESPGAHGYPLWKLLHFGRGGGYDVYPIRKPFLRWLTMGGKYAVASHTSPGPIEPQPYLRKSRKQISDFGRRQANELGLAISHSIMRAAAE